MSKRKYVFPEMLKILLEEREMTQRVLAFKIRSSPYTVWAWLNKGTVPSAIMLTEVAEVFNVSLDYLVYGEEYGQTTFDKWRQSNRSTRVHPGCKQGYDPRSRKDDR